MRVPRPCRAIISVLALPLAFVAQSAAQDEPVYKGEERSRALSEQELSDKEREREAKVAAAKIRQRETLRRFDAVQKALADDYPSERKKWQAEVEPLLTNDTGRRIAQDKQALKTFEAAYSTPKATPEQVAGALEDLARLRAPVEKALRDDTSAYEPDAATLQGLAKKETFAREAVGNYSTSREAIQALIQRVSESPLNPTSPTLDAALAAERARETMERFAAEQRAKDADAASERALEEKRREEKRKQAEADETQRLEQERQAAERRREVLRLANDPEFQRAFSPFLAKSVTRVGIAGRYQRTGAYPGAYLDIAKAGGFASAEYLRRLAHTPDGARGRRPRGNPDLMLDYFPYFEEVAQVWVAQCKLLYSAEDAGKPCVPKDVFTASQGR